MTDRIIVCSTEDDLDPEWERLAVWEDGEWVTGQPMLPGALSRVGDIDEDGIGDGDRDGDGDEDKLTAEELLTRLDGPRVYAFRADDAPA